MYDIKNILNNKVLMGRFAIDNNDGEINLEPDNDNAENNQIELDF